MTRPYSTDTASLLPAHLADLRALLSDPGHAVPPIRRRMFLRLRLIAPCQKQPTPSDKRRARPPKRRYELTELGRKVASR